MKPFRTETDSMGEMQVPGLQKAEFEELLDLAIQTDPGLMGARKCNSI